MAHRKIINHDWIVYILSRIFLSLLSVLSSWISTDIEFEQAKIILENDFNLFVFKWLGNWIIAWYTANKVFWDRSLNKKQKNGHFLKKNQILRNSDVLISTSPPPHYIINERTLYVIWCFNLIKLKTLACCFYSV